MRLGSLALRLRYATVRKRHRTLLVEHLERHECPAFCYSGVVAGVHTWTGTQFPDTLNAIYVSGGTIWWETASFPTESHPCINYTYYGRGPFDTGVSAPTAAAPISIRIYGLEGNDTVTFWGSAVGARDNMGGFPRLPGAGPAVTTLIFNGDEGNDEFLPPDPVAGPGTSPVILPAGSMPNIRFYGARGNDTLTNFDDPEYFEGGDDMDTATVGAGAGAGNDVFYGNDDTDTLDGGADNDTIYGGNAGDVIHGGPDDDAISGGAGNDILYGDDNDDTINGDEDCDRIWGGKGDDVINTGPSGPNLVNDEGAPGGDYSEIVFGEDDDDLIYALQATGNTYLDGGNGMDRIEGSPFSDAIVGGADGDTLLGFGGTDTIHGNAGTDDIFGGDAADALYGDAGLDTIHGDEGPDVLHGGTEHDILFSGYDFAPDQPYNGVGPNPTWPDMKGTGEQDCDIEDGYPDGEPGCVCGFGSGGTPVAHDDFYAAVPMASGNVLENDENIIGGEVTLITPPSYAMQFSLDICGDFSYTIDAGYSQDSFTYTFTVSGQTSNVATVYLEGMPDPLMLDSEPIVAGPGTRSITSADLALLASEAVNRWVLAGVDPITAQRALAGTRLEVADLPGSMLGVEVPGRIVIDIDAAGHGWFIDATPESDEEFDILVDPSERQAGRGSVANGRADLLTALIHEFGHSLGMVHLEGEEFAHSVMNDTLGLSMRRTATAADILAADEFYALLWESGSTIRRTRW